MTLAARCAAWLLLLTLVLCQTTRMLAASELDRATRNVLSANYTLAILLTNGDAVRFGFWNFNPNDYFELDNDDLGSADSAQLRQSITTASLPFDWTLPIGDQGDTLTYTGKVAYIAQEQDAQLVVSDEQRKDKVYEQIVSASAGAAWTHPFTKPVTVTFGSLVHWMRYKNDTNYNTAASQAVQSELDGTLTNITVDALVAEPTLTLGYSRPIMGADWDFFSDYHYMRGHTIGTRNPAHEADPEAWFWSNGVRIRNPIISRFLPGQNIWIRAARIDVGGDIGDQLGNSYYYEAGLAWLLEARGRIPLVDNVAIGVNFNYGSVLRGGSLIFTFNED
ncbi:Solitary outer membrane autotransporter beta-barrel domain [Marinobacter mangrovi]|uniref:Solitary outer membrane autotransporter beta-barrel domain n=1 Tax=Marinobacter mangrovi TaxID=2803918 RepID=UPI001931696D|nr:Solitary outer membrane autotransporter beta-barrel domain [Marinobacter mangrovi]